MIYDTLILGGGPGGYTAAIYSARYNLKCLVIARELGGVMNEAWKVENYPGFPSINGMELMNKIREHVNTLGVEIREEEIIEVSKLKNIFKVKTDKNVYEAKTLIVALGAGRRKLNVPGEKELNKKGVSYCFTCDGPFYKNKKVIVVGGGDAAAQGALLLSSYGNNVTLLYRSVIRAEPAYVNQLKKLKNVKLVKGELKEIKGKKNVESVIFKDGKEEKVDGVFIEIGSEPDLSMFKFKFELENIYIKVDKYMKTSVNGVFAAGDVTNVVLRQAVTAAGDGAIAAHSAYEYVNKS